MASSGGGWGMFFKQELGRGGYNFYLKIFWGGFSFKKLHFFKNHRPPWDVINNRSLTIIWYLGCLATATKNSFFHLSEMLTCTILVQIENT